MPTGKPGPKRPARTPATSGDVAESLIHDLAPAQPAERPWFEVPDKLLAAVVARAQQDEAFARRVVAAAGLLARNRTGLAKVLKLSAAKARAGNPGTDVWKLSLLAETHRVWLARKPRGAREDVIRFILARVAWFGVTSRSGAERLLARALAAFPSDDRAA